MSKSPAFTCYTRMRKTMSTRSLFGHVMMLMTYALATSGGSTAKLTIFLDEMRTDEQQILFELSKKKASHT